MLHYEWDNRNMYVYASQVLTEIEQKSLLERGKVWLKHRQFQVPVVASLYRGSMKEP